MNKKNILFILLTFVFSTCLAQSQQSSKFRWAADAEGNAPYIFQNPNNPEQIIGFEVDIANAIAEVLGMEATHIQNQWDGLIPGLSRNDYDLVINGIEITEDRAQEVLFSFPYYVTNLQLVVWNETNNINSLNDLIGKKAGALKGSYAERILSGISGIETLTYEGEVNAFADVSNKRIDAALVDAPIALYYAAANPQFKLVGQPISEIQYGITFRKSDLELKCKVDSALKVLIENGKLRDILEKWKLWNYSIATLFNDKSPSRTLPEKYEEYVNSYTTESSFEKYFNRYFNLMPIFGEAALITLGLSIVAMLLAVFLGFIVAVVRVYAPQPLSGLAVLYIEIIRGTPLLIQLFLIFYGLPAIGIKLSPFLAAIVGLGMNYAAYEAENYRAGFFSVPLGQMEAAISLGMSKRQALRYIIFPQAFRLVIPPVTNDFISLLKDSSLVSVITMVELTKVYNQVATTYFDFFGTGIIVAVIYLLLGLPFVRLAKFVENKYSFDKRKLSI